MTPQRCQPSFAYSRSAAPLAVSSTSSVLPALKLARSAAASNASPTPCRRQQCLADAVPPRTPMHQHFRNVGTVRLILDLRKNDLHGADDLPRRVLCDD
jgi:hypothetical protein